MSVNKSTPKKKVKRMTISIHESKLIKKDLKTMYKKWQLKICKWIKVTPADAYDYLYQIRYTSNQARINPDSNNVIINKQGRLFVVLKELNGLAMIVTEKPSVQEPLTFGTFYILEKPKQKPNTNLKKV